MRRATTAALYRAKRACDDQDNRFKLFIICIIIVNLYDTLPYSSYAKIR